MSVKVSGSSLYQKGWFPVRGSAIGHEEQGYGRDLYGYEKDTGDQPGVPGRRLWGDAGCHHSACLSSSAENGCWSSRKFTGAGGVTWVNSSRYHYYMGRGGVRKSCKLQASSCKSVIGNSLKAASYKLQASFLE